MACEAEVINEKKSCCTHVHNLLSRCTALFVFSFFLWREPSAEAANTSGSLEHLALMEKEGSADWSRESWMWAPVCATWPHFDNRNPFSARYHGGECVSALQIIHRCVNTVSINSYYPCVTACVVFPRVGKTTVVFIQESVPWLIQELHIMTV